MSIDPTKQHEAEILDNLEFHPNIGCCHAEHQHIPAVWRLTFTCGHTMLICNRCKTQLECFKLAHTYALHVDGHTTPERVTWTAQPITAILGGHQ